MAGFHRSDDGEEPGDGIGWNEQLDRESMPLAVDNDRAEATLDAFACGNLVAPGPCDMTVDQKVDACDAGYASRIPNRHRCRNLVTVGRRIARGCDKLDPIDLEHGP